MKFSLSERLFPSFRETDLARSMSEDSLTRRHTDHLDHWLTGFGDNHLFAHLYPLDELREMRLGFVNIDFHLVSLAKSI